MAIITHAKTINALPQHIGRALKMTNVRLSSSSVKVRLRLLLHCICIQIKYIIIVLFMYKNYYLPFHFLNLITFNKKVALIGAAGGIGQPLGLLLKKNPAIAHLALYGTVF